MRLKASQAFALAELGVAMREGEEGTSKKQTTKTPSKFTRLRYIIYKYGHLVDKVSFLTYTVLMIYIPITQNILSKHKNTIFYYCLHYQLNTQGQMIELTTKPISIKTWLRQDNTVIGAEAQVSREMSRRRKFESYEEFSENSIGLLPLSLFEELKQALFTLPTRSRNSTLRLFLYLYLGMRRNVVFHVSIETTSVDIQMSTKQVSQKIRWWMERGFLERVGTYNFSYEDTFAYGYTLPAAWSSSDIDFGGTDNEN